MTAIDDVLKDAKFTVWPASERRALSKMLYNVSHGMTTEAVTNQTDRVWLTLIKIQNTHLDGV